MKDRTPLWGVVAAFSVPFALTALVFLAAWLTGAPMFSL